MFTKLYTSRLFKAIAMTLAFVYFNMGFTLAAVCAGADDPRTLKPGTPVILESQKRITSEFLKVGQTVDFIVKQDVIVNGKTVIAAGALASGQVVKTQKARGLGKPGEIDIIIKSVKAADGQDVLLSGSNVNTEGDDRSTTAILLGVLVCILLLTIKGKNAEIPAGYPVNASVAQEITIEVR